MIITTGLAPPYFRLQYSPSFRGLHIINRKARQGEQTASLGGFLINRVPPVKFFLLWWP